MGKIDWKAKLSSRKFWAAIIAFVTTILTAFNINQMTIEQVIAVIGGVSSMMIYIFAETSVDVARIKNQTNITNAAEIKAVNAIGFETDKAA